MIQKCRFLCVAHIHNLTIQMMISFPSLRLLLLRTYLNVTGGKIKQHSSPNPRGEGKGDLKLLLLFAAMTGWVLKAFHDNRSKQSLVISKILFLHFTATTTTLRVFMNNVEIEHTTMGIPVTSLTFLRNFIVTFNQVFFLLFKKDSR